MAPWAPPLNPPLVVQDPPREEQEGALRRQAIHIVNRIRQGDNILDLIRFKFNRRQFGMPVVEIR